MNETKETKPARKGIVITLGIICVILVASLFGAIAYYTMTVRNKENELNSAHNTINQLNATIARQNDAISQLNWTITNLQNQLNNLTQKLNTAQGIADGFQLTMTLEKTQYSLGEPINITLALTNISNQTVSFWLDYSFSYFRFLVYNSTNSAIYSSLYNGEPVLPLMVLFTLNAGQSMGDYFSWEQTIFSPEGVPVLPGTYYIVGQVGPVQEVYNSTIETTPIQITIS
jgi:uncharacterized coiled-coil protein SlyX